MRGFEQAMATLQARLESIDRRLRSMEVDGPTAKGPVASNTAAVPSVAAAVPASSLPAGTAGTSMPSSQTAPERMRASSQSDPFPSSDGAFMNRTEMKADTEDNIPTASSAPVPASTVASRLSQLLEAHPYLDPDRSGETKHGLHYWVRRCRKEIKEGHADEAKKYLEAIERGIEASHQDKKAAFGRFDIDQDGQLDSEEFQCMCAYLGIGETQANEMFREAMEDGKITLEEFETAVGKAGGLVKLLQKRREQVARSQWGEDAHHVTHAGGRVRSFFYVKGKKSKGWKEAQVLSVNVKDKCPDAPKDGVLLLFGYGSDSGGADEWQAQQVVPPSWIVSGSDDAQVSLALREVGILDEQQGFWAKIFPEHELRAMARLVTCQRQAVRTVRQQATILHEKALPEVKKKFADLGFGNRELQSVLTWIEDLAPTVIHVHLDTVGRFMEIDDFYRNQFETHTSCGALDDGNQTRIGWERELFGGAYDSSKAFERPKYGALSVMNDYRGAYATQYGDSYLVLKNVRLRCTFAATDSGGIEGNRLAVLDKYAHVLNEYNDDELKGLIRVAMAASAAGDRSSTSFPELLRGSTVDSQQEWVTLGFPTAKQSQGCFYFEVQLEEGCQSPQVGVVTDRFELTPDVRSAQGVGDDAESWSVDGLHAARWHKGEIRAWGQSWASQDNVLSEVVVVGVAVDLDTGKLWFSSNGTWDGSAAFDISSSLRSGANVYPAVSLQGMATYNFGPEFKHQWQGALSSCKPWPSLAGAVQVTSPLAGDSSILSIYKEIQIHGEVNLRRNVQRLVACSKHKDMPKSQRSWSMSVSGAGACSGEFRRAGAVGDMPKYECESGARLEFVPSERCWRIFEKDSASWFASAKVETDGVYQPPRKGWEVPDEALGVVTVQDFKKALMSAGLQETAIQRLIDVLSGTDSKGNAMVFKKRGEVTLKDEWEKLVDPPMDSNAAWDAVVEETKQMFLQQAGFSAGAVIETAHPYNSGPQNWTKDVSLKGSSGLDVYFASKTSTLDSYARINISAGPLTKTNAGPGARVHVKTCGQPDNIEFLRGHVEARSTEDNSWRVLLEEEDVKNSYTYQSIFGEEEEEKDDEEEGEENKEAKSEPQKLKLFCTCALEHKSASVSYKDGKKIGDEIAGFSVDRASPLTPVSITSFNQAGPAQEAGVKSGWFLDLSALFNSPAAEKVMSLEGDDLGDAPDGVRGALADLDSFGKRLNKLLDMSDIELPFINGLDAKLLPSTVVKYEAGVKVGDEIESFSSDGQCVTVSNFKDEAESNGTASDSNEASLRGRLRVALEEAAASQMLSSAIDQAPTIELPQAKKAVKVSQDAGVQQGWQLDLWSTMKHSSLKVTEEDILSDPSCLLELSDVTLVFEPPGNGDEDLYAGYGNSVDGDSTWETAHIPQNSCTFKWTSDHDGSNTDEVRWGIFAVVVPAGLKKASQEDVDKLSEKWSNATSRAIGIEPDSIQVEPQDWDEQRIRALCAKYGWEFEWMTVEGERQRRTGERKSKAASVAQPRNRSSELPDGCTSRE